MVHVHVESDVMEDAEANVSRVMGQFGFGKTAPTDDHLRVSLPPWIYFGECADDERALSTRLRSKLELNVLVVPAGKFHIAYTQGSMLGISDLDPDREGAE
jgi:hypothetical protein